MDEKDQAGKDLALMTYMENLQDVLDVLMSIEPKDSTWDEAILRAIREVNEIKCYFKNQS